MTPDALVSELRDVFRVDQGETLHPRHPKCLGNLAADAIGRLTRERDRLYEIAIKSCNATDGFCVSGVSVDFLSELPSEILGMKSRLYKRAETAEAERDAARRELAECRNKALEEAKTTVAKGIGFHSDVDEILESAQNAIERLKTEA